MPTLVPCLVQLRQEFNEIAPNRDKSSDGWIGDDAHSAGVSDHNPDETGNVPTHDADKVNEVHAIDVDDDLKESDLTMEKVVQFILTRCRKDNDDPANEPRLKYIIYNRRIWEAPAWKERAYSGPSPHTEHAHFSAEYISSLEADTSTWKLKEIPVALTSADKTWLSAEIKKQAEAAVESKKDEIGAAVLATKVSGTSMPNNSYVRTIGDILGDVWCLVFRGDTKGGDPIPSAGVWGQILSLLRAPAK